MSNRMTVIAGKALASLVLPPLLGALAGGAYALVCGGVHWVIRGEGDRVLVFAGKCIAGGTVLGLVVAACRVTSFAWTMATRPKTALEPDPNRVRVAISPRGPDGLPVVASSADQMLPLASPPPNYPPLSSPHVFSAERGPAMSI